MSGLLGKIAHFAYEGNVERPANIKMQRLEQLSTWLSYLYPGEVGEILPASEDAGFRRYFRVSIGGINRIVMDAPPERENCRPFLRIGEVFRAAGVHVPEVHAQDLTQGFLLLSDLGPTTYLDKLNADNADRLFTDAIDALIRIQLASRADVLPEYSRELLLREMRLFPEWYIGAQYATSLSPELAADLDVVFERIVENNLRQPRVFVHRDYMPRNLMVSQPNPGVLDFQDAVYGPITYDVLSLFKDAFLLGGRARTRLGQGILEPGSLRRSTGQRRLRYFSSRLGMDGPAAPPQSVGYLRAPQLPGWQATLPR